MMANQSGIAMTEFVECAACAAKSGMPVLCSVCLHNRTAISLLQKEIQRLALLVVPPLVGLSVDGKFRVYFNRHGAEPLMWCIAPDAGGWEIAVRDVGISTHAETVYRKKETADEDDGRPSAWIAVEGVLTINGSGFATIGSP